jgi:circadian clock protein KaiC
VALPILTEKTYQNGAIERTPTGDLVLDAMLEGGLPKNRVTYVAGYPGTGKTTLAAAFIYRGAKEYGERGVYLSFCEPKAIFYTNMKAFGFDFVSLEEDKKFEFIEMTMRPDLNITTISNKLVPELVRLQPKRLVVDSFAVISESQDTRYKAREIMDTVFSKLASDLGCTTLVLGEQPTGEVSLGTASEEFVADGVLNLKYTLPREMEIRKMRGIKIVRESLLYTIGRDGFQTVKTSLSVPDKPTTWKPMPDLDNLLSSGSSTLDQAIGGGFPRGEYVVLEAASNVTLGEIKLFSRGIILNFISQGRGVIFSTTGGGVRDRIRNLLVPYLSDEVVDQYLTVIEYDTVPKSEPITRVFPTTRAQEDLGYQDRVNEAYDSLKKKTGGKPLLQWISYDALASHFSVIPHGEVVRQIASNVSGNMADNDLTIAVARPSLRVRDALVDIVDWHLQLWKRNGVMVLQGIKPETRMYALDTHIEQGYPVMSLTELG